MDKPWRLCLFGRPRVLGHGLVLDQFGTRRSALLLARVALARNKTLSRSDAADTLWPDDFYDATRIRLRQELSRLRKVLGPARDLLETDDEIIRLNVTEAEIDVDAFERLFQTGQRETDSDRRREALQLAKDLSCEPFLEGDTDLWVELERARLAALRYAVLVDLGHISAGNGQHEGALALAREAIEINPILEAAHVLAMQALGSLGFMADALNQYQLLRRLLRENDSSLSEDAERVAESLRAHPIPAPTIRIPKLSFQVPASPEPIRGRESELAIIQSLLEPNTGNARLVTLLGPGGIGKTRLGIEAVNALSGPFEGRIAFISLADLVDHTLVPTAILAGLNWEVAQTGDPIGQLIALVPSEPTLFMLDNLEQLTPQVGPTLGRLLEGKPNLRILCTSRNALNVSGEITVRIEPLQLPKADDNPDAALRAPAVSLFLELIQASGSPNPKSEDTAVLVEIARRLEGIPLALQLGAARLRSATPQELLDQLDRRVTLVNRRVDAPERHRTMFDAVRGSFDNLSPSLRRAFPKLSVFRGGWTQEAAAEVCGLETPVETMETLLDASLVLVDQEDRKMRFRMLETIREFGFAQLSSSERNKVSTLHARWILGLAQSAAPIYATRGSLQAYRTLDSEKDNVREACRYALDHDQELAFELGAALGAYWFHRGLAFEAQLFYQELFAKPFKGPVTKTIADAAFGHCGILHNMVNPDRGPIFERAIGFYRELGCVREEALILSLLSLLRLDESRFEESQKLAAEAEEKIAKSGSAEDLAFVQRAWAMLHYHQGRGDQCIEVGKKILATFIDSGSIFYQFRAKQFLAFASVEFGDLDLAESALNGLLEEAIETGAAYQIPNIQEVSGLVAMERGNLEEAIVHLTESATNWRDRGVPFQAGDLNNTIGRCHLRLGNLEAAHEHFRIAVETWRPLNKPLLLSSCLIGLADLWCRKGDPKLAAALYATALREQRSIDGQRLTEAQYADAVKNELDLKLGAGWRAADWTLDEALLASFSGGAP